jgi:hypothetical protein
MACDKNIKRLARMFHPGTAYPCATLGAIIVWILISYKLASKYVIFWRFDALPSSGKQWRKISYIATGLIDRGSQHGKILIRQPADYLVPAVGDF